MDKKRAPTESRWSRASKGTANMFYYLKDSNALLFITYMAYFYVVVLTLNSFLWYPSNSYTPNPLYYHFYPMALSIGGFLGAIWSQKRMFIIIQFVGGLLSICASITFVVIYFQTQDTILYVDYVFGGVFGYPYLDSTLNLEVTSAGSSYVKNGFLVSSMALNFCNLGFGLISAFMAMSVLRHPPRTPSDGLGAEGQMSGLEMFVVGAGARNSRLRCAMTWFSFMGVLLAVLYCVFIWVALANDVQLYSPFTNQYAWLVVMLVLGMSPPPKLFTAKELPPLGNDENRDYAVSTISPEGLTWMMGLFMGCGVGTAALAYTSNWRADNNLPLLCTDQANFTDAFNSTLYYFLGGATVQYSIMNVTYYTETGDSSVVAGSLAWMTCADDWIGVLLVAFGWLVFVLGIFMEGYAGISKWGQKEVEEAKLLHTLHNENVALQGVSESIDNRKVISQGVKHIKHKNSWLRHHLPPTHTGDNMRLLPPKTHVDDTGEEGE